MIFTARNCKSICSLGHINDYTLDDDDDNDHSDYEVQKVSDEEDLEPDEENQGQKDGDDDEYHKGHAIHNKKVLMWKVRNRMLKMETILVTKNQMLIEGRRCRVKMMLISRHSMMKRFRVPMW